MAAKMGLVVKLAVVVLLLAAVSASARSVDLFDLLASNNPGAFRLVKHKTDGKACCNACLCTKSIPPQCRCMDTFSDADRCDGCDACICALSNPPLCRCIDVKSYCPPKCSSARTTAGSAQAAEATTVALEMITSSN